MQFETIATRITRLAEHFPAMCYASREADICRLQIFSDRLVYYITLRNDLFFDVFVEGTHRPSRRVCHQIRAGFISSPDPDERVPPDSFQRTYSLGEFVACVRLYLDTIAANTASAAVFKPDGEC